MNKKLIRYNKLLKKVISKHKQAFQRGEIKEYTWLYPPVIQKINLNEIDENHAGRIGIEPYSPDTSVELVDLAKIHLELLRDTLLQGKRPPQNRLRKNHKRDIALVKNRPMVVAASRNGSNKVEISKNTLMDEIVEKEIEHISNITEYAKADKRARKKLTQAKYRFLHAPKK